MKDNEIGKYLINIRNGHVGKIVEVIVNQEQKIYRLLTDLYYESIDSIIELNYEDIVNDWVTYYGLGPVKNISKMKLLDQRLIDECKIQIKGKINPLKCGHYIDVVLPKFSNYNFDEDLKENEKINVKKLKMILN